MNATFLLTKVEDIDDIMRQFNSFDKNTQFTIDRFEDGILHFLDININGCETNLYYKTSHTGQYCDFTSQTSWKLNISWIKILYDCLRKICPSKKLLKGYINRIMLSYIVE